MHIVTNAETLHQTLEILRIKREENKLALKKNFNEICESLTPANIIKNSMEGLVGSDHKGDVGNAAIGVASGLLVKKLLFKSTTNPLKKLAGVAVQAIVTKIAARHSDSIKESGKNIFKRLADKLRRKEVSTKHLGTE